MNTTDVEKLALALAETHRLMAQEHKLTQSQIELQREHQRKTMDAMMKVLKKPTKVGSNFFHKQMLNQKSTDFPPIPAERNEFSIPLWNKNVKSYLSKPPWSIDVDGSLRSILDPNLPEHTLSSKAYTVRV